MSQPTDLSKTHKISRLVFNWYTDAQGFECSREVMVGEDNCVDIVEYIPKNGDLRWHYDIYFSNGDVERTFNPNRIEYIIK